ncbi:HAD-IIB family hydrolase [Bengtsoniella intestinalis]|uniref:HAD-IIB family hydrolase n=1 Tax=Bengtsoniella intestinalis TaxID=3073143 RepID=UPI00391EF34A
MGRFDGVLLMSDFDNTLVFTADALTAGKDVPPLHPKNQAALAEFVAEGGQFGVATGRALAAFMCYVSDLPINVPCVTANGGGLYDFKTQQYLYAVTLPEIAAVHGQEIIDAFPRVAVEAYPNSQHIYVVQRNHVTDQHEVLTQVKCIDEPDLSQVPQPLAKLLFTGFHEDLLAIKDFLTTKPWAEEYELIFSGEHLLEMTSKEASKGAMVTRLADYLGIDMAHVYCAGDEANDMSMLQIAAQGFAPENAIPAVKALDVVPVCHAKDGAIAQVVARLKERYPA